MTSSQQADDQQSRERQAREQNTSEQGLPANAQQSTQQPTTPAEAETADVISGIEAVEAPAPDPGVSGEHHDPGTGENPETDGNTAEPADAASAPGQDDQDKVPSSSPHPSPAPSPGPVSSPSGAPAPGPRPGPRAGAPPGPRPGPRPGPAGGVRPGPPPSGRPGPGAAPAPAPTAPLAAPSHSTPLSEAARFARVSVEGHVSLLDGGEEVAVGQYPDATEQEALGYFVRKYDDVVSQALLLEQRAQAGAPVPEMQKTLDHLRQTVAERSMVGDMPALRARLESLQTTLAERRAADKAAHEQAQADQLAARETIVAEAEDLAAKDPNQVQWKRASGRMAELFDDWKAAQRQGPRLSKSVEDGLWKRFRAARTTFDKHRRAFFSRLDANNAEAKAVKEKLIARAEALSSSTDWGPTAGAYRELMDEWKAAPRASRREDDTLWARFRAAQDTFFAARKAANDEIDREYAENLKVKEQILADGRKLLPVTDVKAGRRALNDLRGRWEEAGRVPRKDVSRMESAFRKLEEGLQVAEDEHWRRTNPETKARTDSALSQLEETIAGLEQDLEAARSQGDHKAVTKAEDALQARRQWLQTLQKSAEGLR